MKLLFLLLMWPAFVARGTPVDHVTFREGFAYDYEMTAQTEIMGMDNITTEIQVTLTPVRNPRFHNLVKLTMKDVTHQSLYHPDKRGHEKGALDAPFYFTLSEHGTVEQVFHSPDDDEDILTIKKSVASVFSHHRQVDDDKSWSYAVDEDDHMGKNMHNYYGERTGEGFTLHRRHSSRDVIWRDHAREIHQDHSGHIHIIHDHEEVIVQDDHDQFTAKQIEDEDAEEQRLRLRSSATMRFLGKRHLAKFPSVSSGDVEKLTNSGLNMKQTSWTKNLPASEVAPKVNKLLRCTNRYGYADRRRVDCVTEIMQLLHHMNEKDLFYWAHNLFIRRCRSDDVDCIKTRKTLVSVVGQVQSSEAQKVIINSVVKKNPSDEELEHSIYHLGAQEKPIQESFNTLKELCFGKNFEHHGVHELKANQRRSCLALGSVVRKMKDSDEAKEVVQHIHQWLEKDLHRVSGFTSREYHNLNENVERSQYISTKHALIETLGNAAHPDSKPVIMKFAVPNFGHADWRHGAINSLRHYHDEEAATTILNTTLNDHMFNVRVKALDHYKAHPKAFEIGHEDEVILEGKNIYFGAYRSLSKRSLSDKMCNLLEKLTLDKEYKLPGIDWKKDVGNKMFGSNFGIKMSNKMHLHISPVTAYFGVESINKAWINAHVRMIVRWRQDIIRAESCYALNFRLYNNSFIKEFTQDAMKTFAENLDIDLEAYADLLIEGVNGFNQILADYNIPELGLFDLDTSSPAAFVKSVQDGIERATNKDWDAYLKEVVLMQLEAHGYDVEELRGMVENSKEAVLEYVNEFVDEHLSELKAVIEDGKERVEKILQTDLGDIDFPLKVLDKALDGITIKDVIDDPEGVARGVVQTVKDEVGQGIKDRQDGLMGMINQVVTATRDFPNKLNKLRDELSALKGELLNIEGLDWAQDIINLVQRIRYYIEDDSANIITFFQDVIDENGITFPFVSELMETANKFIEIASNELSMSPTQAITDITRAMRQIKGGLTMFANVKERLEEFKGDVGGKLGAAFMGLGEEYEQIKEDLEGGIEKVRKVIERVKGNTLLDSKDRFLPLRAPTEKLQLKLPEIDAAEKALASLDKIKDGVFDLNYLADEYLDGVDRIMGSLEITKERFEKLKKSVQEAKEFVNEVFGIRFHPAFPDDVRDECDEECGCGIYPSHMYGMAGSQLMIDEGDPIVCPLDGYVLVSKERPNEIILRPLDDDMEHYEFIISHISPVDDILKVDKEDADFGVEFTSGVVIGHATKAPCSPNFIFVAQRGSTKDNPENDKPGTTPAPDDAECGSMNVGPTYFSPVDDVNEDDDQPEPRWLFGCSHATFKTFLDVIDLKAFTEKFQQLRDKLERKLVDIGEKLEDWGEMVENAIPDDIDFEVVMLLVDELEELVDLSKFQKKIKKVLASKPFEKVYKWADGVKLPEIAFPDVQLKFPVIQDIFDINAMRVGDMKDLLINMNLADKANELTDMAGDLLKNINANIWDNPLKFSPTQLRTKLEGLGDKIDGLSLDSISTKFMSKIKACGGGLAFGEGSICDSDNKCAQHICSLKTKVQHFIERMNFTFEHDCSRKLIIIGVNDHTFEISYEDGVDITVERSFTLKDPVTVTVTCHLEISKEDETLTVTITAVPCTSLICSPPLTIMKDLEIEFDDDCDDWDKPEDDGLTMDDIMRFRMEDFMFFMDRLGQDRSKIFQLVNELRTATFKTLHKGVGLVSGIDGNEIFDPQDAQAEDKRKKLGEFDLIFFRLPFKFPLIPLIFSVEVGAGGAFGVNFGANTRLLSSEVSITLDPWIAGKAWGDGGASIVGMGGGVKLTGYLLETHFPFTMIFQFDEYPIRVIKKLDVELIPLRCEFKGYVKVVLVKIPFKIFEWSAEKLSWNIFTKTDHIDDKTGPVFVGEQPPGSSYTYGVENYSANNGKCFVEQVIGRHPSDAAFFLEAPFFDEESDLEIVYAIGTFAGGTNVLNWTPMESPSIINSIQLKETGVPVHWTVKAKNTQGLETVVQCKLDTFDVTLPSGRIEPNHVKTSHPTKLTGSAIIIDDSPLLEDQYVGVGVGQHYFGQSVVNWHLFEFEKNPINKEASGPMEHFAMGRVGRLTVSPFKESNERFDYECAWQCIEFGEKCVSFDFEYETDTCLLHSVIEGPGVLLRTDKSFHNFERLSAGHSAWFSYDNLELIHGEVYYINTKITNNMAYENYMASLPIVVDFTPPEPGPLGDIMWERWVNDGCKASINHPERCIEVTDRHNHRIVIDGPGADTVFNGNWPKLDMKYTISNNFICANWDGFHDNETDLWAYTWAAGTKECAEDVVEYEDPHSHLADSSYWNHQGYRSNLVLNMGAHYTTVQALNDVVFGGALVVSVCHHVPLIIDLTPPILHIVENVFYDEAFDIMAIYYEASDPESGIMRTDYGLGETQHDVFVRAYSRHDPIFDGYEMITVDDVDLPEGVPMWVRIRPVNNVELLTASHGDQPIMIDRSPPIAGDVLDGDKLYDLQYQPDNHTMCAQWLRWYDPESGMGSYLWGIGSTPDFPDIMDFTSYDHWHRMDCIEISLNHSQKYYNIIRGYNQALNALSVNKSSDGVVVDVTDPVAGWVNDGENMPYDMMYSSKPATVSAYWGDFYDPESGIVNYEVSVDVNFETMKTSSRRADQTFLRDHTYHLKHDDFVEVTVEAEDGATRKNSSISTGVKIDLTPPEMLLMRDSEFGYRFTTKNDEMYAIWQFKDPESFIKEYRMLIYSHEGRGVNKIWPKENYKVYDPNEENDYLVETTVKDLKLKNGIKYSVEVVGINKAGLSTKHESHGVIVDTTPPYLDNVYIGFYGADEYLNDDDEVIQADEETIHASWLGYDHESGIINFMVAVGKFPGDDSVTGGFIDYGSELSGYIYNLNLNVTAETGDVYYVSVQAMNGAGAMSPIVSSRPIHVYGANVPGTVSDGRKADEDAKYQQDTTSVGITFSGFESPACGIRSYEWALGTEPGWSDILPYSSVGIVMLNDSHGQAQAHLHVKHGLTMYASVRAHTGHACHEDIIHSSSDGNTVDIEGPIIVITNIGLLGMDNITMDIVDALNGEDAIFQSQFDSIDFRWNVTDDVSRATNVTWMAGKLPLTDDIHEETMTNDDQIPLLSVVMRNRETVIFSLQATDEAGNPTTVISPPLTIDTTPPEVTGFECSKFVSKAKPQVTCHWESTLDEESPLTLIRIGIGIDQMQDELIRFRQLTILERTWSIFLDDQIFDNYNGSVYISLLVTNMVDDESGAFAEIILDSTPPETGEVLIVTTEVPGDTAITPKICQRSATTMTINFENFHDPESFISRYEVGVGTYEGGTDIHHWQPVDDTKITLDKLAMVPGELVYASVRAVNKASLVSSSVSASVYVSPNPSLLVYDGLDEEDLNFQHDISSISGHVLMSHHCPIVYGSWKTFDLLGNEITESSQFFKNHFANDELRLTNMRTYFVEVEVMDAINRTLRGRSNGITVLIQPPDPGAVRDGPHYGEDRNYQQSTSELSVNWDDFGKDEPGMRIEYYEVALGDNPAYATTRSNTHYFVNVGLEKNYTFVNLRLIKKTVTYYATVRAHAENGAHVDATSNGVKAGFTPGMLAGEIELQPFTNNSASLTTSWSGFWSDFRIIHYHIGISSEPIMLSNETVACRQYLPMAKDYFDVSRMIDVNDNTYATIRLLRLEHNKLYYVTVIAEDEPGQCIASLSKRIHVDLTPPMVGSIQTNGISKQAQYLINPEVLHVSWTDFEDPESDIADFYLQVFQGDMCNDGDVTEDQFTAISPVIDVKNETDISLYEYTFVEGRPYKIGFYVKNNAGSETFTWSDPIFVDTTPANAGAVKDGNNWMISEMYQPNTDKLEATIAISPLGTGLLCRTHKRLINFDMFDKYWTVLKDEEISVKDEFDIFETVVEYQPWNVKIKKWEEEDVEFSELDMIFHRNISLLHMEGGGIVSRKEQLHQGTFDFHLKVAKGENTITSMTMSEGELDEFTRFTMINFTEPMDDDEFQRNAESMEINWGPLDPNITSSTQLPSTETPDDDNSTVNANPEDSIIDVHGTDGFGLHFVGMPFGEREEVWFMMMWVRSERRVMLDWVMLDFDPTATLHHYQLKIETDQTTRDDLWNLGLYVDDMFMAEMVGVLLPNQYSVKIRNWNHDDFITELQDPFHPFMTKSVVRQVDVPLPQDKMCHYGEAFYDMESGVEEVYIGVGAGNASATEDNVVPYQLAAQICHSCIYRCDVYKCQENCTIKDELEEGYYLLHLGIDDLSLHPGDTRYILDDDDYNDISDLDDEFEEFNQTFFDSIRYHFLVKVINQAGLVTYASSPGILIDPTPPIPTRIVSVDPEFDMILVATHQGHTDTLAAWWEFNEPESFVTHYQVAVGLQPNGTEIMEWTNMDLQEELIIHDLHLENFKTYYFTVEATNAAGLKSIGYSDGITIKLGNPSVDDSTAELPYDEKIETEEGEILLIEKQDEVSVSIGGMLPDDVEQIIWEIGISPKDSYIMRQIFVDRNDARNMEIRDGYFWYNGVQSDFSFLEAGVRTMEESNMTEGMDMSAPGSLHLAPGTCIYHHIHAINWAHQTTNIPLPPLCVKRSFDSVLNISDGPFDDDFSQGDISGSIKGKGISGIIQVGVLSLDDLRIKVETSGNLTYSPSIINPEETSNYTSRVLHGRMINFSGRSVYIAPIPQGQVESPLEITMSFDGVQIEQGEFISILFWDHETRSWHQAVESCGIGEQVDYTQNTVTAWFCGYVEDNADDILNDVLNVMQTHFILHTVDENFYNDPPKLLTKHFEGLHNSLLEKQLEYIDPEGDEVEFEIITDPLHGMANLTIFGELSYMPSDWFFGDDTIVVRMMEIGLPPVIPVNVVEELVSIHIKEPKMFPHIYLETDHALIDDFKQGVGLVSGAVDLGYEGNMTFKDIGMLYLCDPNKDDTLELLTSHEDGNITCTVNEHAPENVVIDQDDMMRCFDGILRSFKVMCNTSKDYHGSDQLTFIGLDNTGRYSQRLDLIVHTMISPCVNGRCVGGIDDPDCRSPDRVHSYEGYGCSCTYGYKGMWCEDTHLIHWQISMLLFSVAAVFVVFSVYGATVIKKRRGNKVAPSPEIKMGEFKADTCTESEEEELETDTESEEEEKDEVTKRDVEIDVPTGVPETRYLHDYKKKAHTAWFNESSHHDMTEIDCGI